MNESSETVTRPNKKSNYFHQRGKSTETRFLEKINKLGPIQPHTPHLGNCWQWMGFVDKGGYGCIRDGKKIKKAHRISWITFNGQIPSGLDVCHKCDHRSCVNPNHLFLGTDKDNARDMINKGRRVYSHAKINPDKAKEIRSRMFSGESPQVLASQFCISVHTVRGLCRPNSKQWPTAWP